MHRLLPLIVLSLTLGCTEPKEMPSNQVRAEANVQLFNEAVPGSSPTDAIPMLLTNADPTWSTKQVILDYKDDACYGAMIHYERSHSFASPCDQFSVRQTRTTDLRRTPNAGHMAHERRWIYDPTQR